MGLIPLVLRIKFDQMFEALNDQGFSNFSINGNFCQSKDFKNITLNDTVVTV
jgi:hypothetical protein